MLLLVVIFTLLFINFTVMCIMYSCIMYHVSYIMYHVTHVSWDSYFVAIDGKRLRSKLEVARYLGYEVWISIIYYLMYDSESMKHSP